MYIGGEGVGGRGRVAPRSVKESKKRGLAKDEAENVWKKTEHKGLYKLYKRVCPKDK